MCVYNAFQYGSLSCCLSFMPSLPIIFLGADSLRGLFLVTVQRGRSLVNIAGEAHLPGPTETHGVLLSCLDGSASS